MPNIDHFSHVISAVAGARASGLKIVDGAVSLMLDVSGLNADARAQMEADVRSAVEQAGATSVRIMLTAERITPRLIAVASGKGGVGKSTLSTNLAIAMARAGRSVGLVDADIFGFSIPGQLGITDKPTRVDEMILPPVAHNVKVISIGMFMDDNKPVAWRGPMLHRAIEQFLCDGKL